MNNRHITLSLCLAFLVVHIIAHDIAGHDSGKFESRIDAFHEILDKMQVGDSHVLPVDKLQKFITELFQQFHCVNGEPVTSSQASKQCSQTLVSLYILMLETCMTFIFRCIENSYCIRWITTARKPIYLTWGPRSFRSFTYVLIVILIILKHFQNKITFSVMFRLKHFAES